MELKSNIKCQLIVEGLPTRKEGFQKIEAILHDEDTSIVSVYVDRTEETWVYDMPADGLYIYYEFDLEEVPEDIHAYMLDNSSNLSEWEKLKHFSICKLRNCTMNLEKEMIHDFFSTCNSNKSCEKKSSERDTRDVLLIGIFVLENLICQQRYVEAAIILNSLQSCNLCKDYASIKKCNC